MVLELEEGKAYWIEYDGGQVFAGRLLKNQQQFGNPMMVLDASFERMYVFDKLLRPDEIKLSGRMPIFLRNGRYVNFDGSEVGVEIAYEGDIEGLIGRESDV